MKINKHIPRIYIEKKININEIYFLSQDHIYYLKKVLRIKHNDILEIFNNTNHIFFAKIIYFNKNIIQIKIFFKYLDR